MAVTLVHHKGFPSHVAVFESLLQHRNIADGDPGRVRQLAAGSLPARLRMEAAINYCLIARKGNYFRKSSDLKKESLAA